MNHFQTRIIKIEGKLKKMLNNNSIRFEKYDEEDCPIFATDDKNIKYHISNKNVIYCTNGHIAKMVGNIIP